VPTVVVGCGLKKITDNPTTGFDLLVLTYTRPRAVKGLSPSRFSLFSPFLPLLFAPPSS
jgi:hypothetical protein